MHPFYCVDCDTFYRVRKNGVVVEEKRDDGSSYRLIRGDLWQCPMCRRCLIHLNTQGATHHYGVTSGYEVEKARAKSDGIFYEEHVYDGS